MNKSILKFARNSIKEGLKNLPQVNVRFFLRMYDHKGTHKGCVDSILSDLDLSQLDHALCQVEKQIEKNIEQEKQP